MLELRYNGCPGCLDSATAILRSIGYFKGRNYRVEFHSDHAKDRLYSVRHDYLDIFSGAILYNPESEHWIDFYTNDHERLAIQCKSPEDIKHVQSIVRALESGE